MKKILFIIPSFRRGGVETITLNIINSLNNKELDIILLVCSGSNNTLLNDIRSSIKIIELHKKNVRGALPEVFKILKKEKPNSVFTSFNHLSLPIITYKYISKSTYKTIVRINSLPSNDLNSNFRGKLYNKLFSKLIRKADIIISQTEEMKIDICNYYKLKSEKVQTIRNIIDFDRIEQQSKSLITESIKGPDTFSFIAIGSLGEVKGFDLLIRAIHNLINKNITNIRLFIIGDNRESNEDYRSKLEKLILKLELKNYVVLLGFKKNPYPYLKQGDAFVLSSRKEGFPNVVLEALSLNKPCLVTNCVDFTGIINNNINGVIVQKNSIEALEAGILEIQKINHIDNSKILNNFNFDYNKWFQAI
ncbi:glycosyltransferase [Proteiniphilum sp.]|uniref:glycosyltransferase n=1 Tax=Proteiniphilum sp. TaxID=1926877 RepID=UPI003320FAC3